MKKLFIDYLEYIEETTGAEDETRQEASKAWKKYAADLQPHADFAQVRGAQKLLERLGLARQAPHVTLDGKKTKTWEYGPEAKKPGRKPKAA